MKNFYWGIFFVSLISGCGLLQTKKYTSDPVVTTRGSAAFDELDEKTPDPCTLDDDKDGVNNCKDSCNHTKFGTRVDSSGCKIDPCTLDDDKDGVNNCKDSCPDTNFGTTVDLTGCKLDPCKQDDDNDGVNNCHDECSGTDFGTAVDSVGCPIATGVSEAVIITLCNAESEELTYKDCKYFCETGGVSPDVCQRLKSRYDTTDSSFDEADDLGFDDTTDFDEMDDSGFDDTTDSSFDEVDDLGDDFGEEVDSENTQTKQEFSSILTCFLSKEGYHQEDASRDCEVAETLANQSENDLEVEQYRGFPLDLRKMRHADLSRIKTITGKSLQDFHLSAKISNDTELIALILLAESMNDGERQYWFNLTEVMSPEQIEKLRDILRRERTKLAEIDAKYAR